MLHFQQYPKLVVNPYSEIVGDCEIGKLVLLSSFAVRRGDEGTSIHVGRETPTVLVLSAIKKMNLEATLYDLGFRKERQMITGGGRGTSKIELPSTRHIVMTVHSRFTSLKSITAPNLLNGAWSYILLLKNYLNG